MAEELGHNSEWEKKEIFKYKELASNYMVKL